MSEWLPSLNALRAFEAVSRHLSYRDAAAELHVTAAAVKQLVQKLEAGVGMPLVERHGRGIALTRAGVAGLPELTRAFKQINAAVAKMRLGKQRKSLTVTVEPAFANAWLVERLDAFKTRYPNVDVLIDSSMRVVDLERETADIGIRYGVRPGKEIVAHRLFDDETLAVCSPAYAVGPPALKQLRDLENVTLLHIEAGDADWKSSTSMHWFDWRAWLETVGSGEIRPGRGLRFNDYNLAIRAAIAGQGVVLASWPIVKSAIEAKLLVSPFAERAKTDVGYDLVATQLAIARPEVAGFVEWILEQVG